MVHNVGLDCVLYHYVWEIQRHFESLERIGVLQVTRGERFWARIGNQDENKHSDQKMERKLLTKRKK